MVAFLFVQRGFTSTSHSKNLWDRATGFDLKAVRVTFRDGLEVINRAGAVDVDSGS